MGPEDQTLLDLVSDWLAIQTDETVRCWERTSGEEVEQFISLLIRSNEIVFAGVGRTRYILEAAAYRFREMGVKASIAESDSSPEFSAKTTLLAACPLGATDWVKSLSKTAKKEGSTVALCTARRNSPLGRIADFLLWVDAFSPGNGRPPASLQQPGALFDQAVFMILEAAAETLVQRRRALS